MRDGNTSAWLRASALETGPAGYAAVAALETGRRASGNQVVSLGVRTYPAPRPNRHALIVGVGAYQADPARKVEALPGVKHDLLNALVVARYLQVPIENTTLLKDEAATREGVARAMSELAARMNRATASSSTRPGMARATATRRRVAPASNRSFPSISRTSAIGISQPGPSRSATRPTRCS